MNELLLEALQPVLRDIRSTEAPEPVLRDEEWVDSSGATSAMLYNKDGNGSGISLELSDSAAERIVRLADQVQEFVIEELQRESRTNWPRCRAHPTSHPMNAIIREGSAIWACPLGADYQVPIGSLPPTQNR